MKKTILIGGGGHALSLLEMVEDINQITGYSDFTVCKEMPIPYLGTDEDILKNYSTNEYNVCISVVYTNKASLELRKKLIKKFEQYEPASFKSPTAIITPNANIKNGVVIFHNCTINRCSIEEHSVINTGAIIEHGCKLGKNVFVGTGAVICGDVAIGNNVFIGAGTVIRDGITIQDNAIIGMGSLVTKNILQEGVYYGSPVQKRE